MAKTFVAISLYLFLQEESSLQLAKGRIVTNDGSLTGVGKNYFFYIMRDYAHFEDDPTFQNSVG